MALLDAAAPELKKSKGNAVFVSSQSARFAFPPHEAYTMSKLALEAFVRTRAFAYAEVTLRLKTGVLHSCSLCIHAAECAAGAVCVRACALLKVRRAPSCMYKMLMCRHTRMRAYTHAHIHAAPS